MIGAKTLASLLLLAAGAAAALALGVLRPERLAAAEASALFFAGAFGVVVGALAFRLWRLDEPSARYLRFATARQWEKEAHFLGGARWRVVLGENRGEAFDLGPRAQQALCIALAFGLGLATVDARALDLMARFRRGVAAANSAYCPEEEKVVDKTDPHAPGCALLRRAYALGYAKDLGDCADPRAGKTERGAAAVCTLRQRDEPFLHYAWRLLDGAWSKASAATSPAALRAQRADFQQRLDQLDELGAARAQILTSAPHAAHHVWTTLPDPQDGAFQGQSCGDRYRQLAHRPPGDGPLGPSRVFEHVLAQLLFESSYEPSAGACREYHVHWGAPADACAQLAAAPEAFLRQWGALDDVRVTLARQRLVARLDELAAAAPGRAEGAAAPEKSQRELPPSAFVSFQCYVQGAEPGRHSLPLKLGELALSAEELRVTPSPPDGAPYADRYAAVASLLVGGFHYGGLLSEGSAAGGAVEGDLEPAFAGKDFLLSRLFGLASLDLYVGPGWLAHRPDLLEVYPYELHLRNFVRVFRRQYLRERGRL